MGKKWALDSRLKIWRVGEYVVGRVAAGETTAAAFPLFLSNLKDATLQHPAARKLPELQHWKTLEEAN